TEIYTLSLHDALPICPTFTRESALSSAQRRFTVLFGMGRSGTTSLWSSGLTGCHRGLEPRQPIHRVFISSQAAAWLFISIAFNPGITALIWFDQSYR